MPLSQPNSDSGRKRAMASPTAVSSLSAGPRSRRSKTRTTSVDSRKGIAPALGSSSTIEKEGTNPPSSGCNRCKEDQKIEEQPEQAKRRFRQCSRSDLTLACFTPGLLQRLPLLDHQLVGDVVLVNVADVLDGRLSHASATPSTRRCQTTCSDPAPGPALPSAAPRCDSGPRCMPRK